MTFEQFKEYYCQEVIPHKPPYIRKGQALFNLLSMKWPAEADRIIEAKMSGDKEMEQIDCFAVDSRISNTLDHLEKVWFNYPN